LRQFNFQALFFCFWCTCSLQELWPPHQSCWRFRSSELLHHVIRQTVTNIWKDHLRLLYPQDKGLRSMELLGKYTKTHKTFIFSL
jgi:hypothetical protein